jgi:hypothetical protein
MRKYMRKTKRRRSGVRTRKRGGGNNNVKKFTANQQLLLADYEQKKKVIQAAINTQPKESMKNSLRRKLNNLQRQRNSIKPGEEITNEILKQRVKVLQHKSQQEQHTNSPKVKFYSPIGSTQLKLSPEAAAKPAVLEAPAVLEEPAVLEAAASNAENKLLEKLEKLAKDIDTKFYDEEIASLTNELTATTNTDKIKQIESHINSFKYLKEFNEDTKSLIEKNELLKRKIGKSYRPNKKVFRGYVERLMDAHARAKENGKLDIPIIGQSYILCPNIKKDMEEFEKNMVEIYERTIRYAKLMNYGEIVNDDFLQRKIKKKQADATNHQKELLRRAERNMALIYLDLVNEKSRLEKDPSNTGKIQTMISSLIEKSHIARAKLESIQLFKMIDDNFVEERVKILQDLQIAQNAQNAKNAKNVARNQQAARPQQQREAEKQRTSSSNNSNSSSIGFNIAKGASELLRFFV